MGQFLFILLYVLLIPALSVATSPLSQKLYEEQIKMKCSSADNQEIARLKKNCSFANKDPKFGDLDQTAEYLVFKPIAEMESEKLGCLLSQTQLLLQSAEIRSTAIHNTCSRLPLLKDALDNQEYLKSWIHTYEVSNDRSIRLVPDAEFKSNEQIIKTLKDQLAHYQDLELTLRAADPLLGSPRIFDEIKSKFKDGLIVKSKSPEMVCRYLNSEAQALIAKDAEDIQKSQKLIQEKLSKDADWIKDENFKKNLWSSSSREDYVQENKADPDFHKSTYCRMEGRYGQGLTTRDGLTNIGILGLGGLSFQFGKLIMSAATAEKASFAAMAARTALSVDVVINTALSVNQVTNSCKESVKVFTDKHSCVNANLTEAKNLFYKKNEAGNCLFDAALAGASVGLGAAGVKSALRNDAKNNLAGELTAHAAESSQKIMKYRQVFKTAETKMEASVVKAQSEYLALHEQYGIPDFNNPLVIKKMNDSLPVVQSPRYKPLPRGPPAEVNEAFRKHYEKILQQNLAHYFPNKDPKNLELIAPSTPPGSGARVYLVKDKITGQIIASLKIQSKSADGLREVSMNLGAEAILAKKAPDVGIVKTQGAGRLTDGDYFLIQSGAPGKDLDGVIHDLSGKLRVTTGVQRQVEIQTTKKAIDETALLFEKIHHSGYKAAPTADDINKFRTNAYYEIQKIEDSVIGPEGTIDKMVRAKDLTPEEGVRLKTKIEQAKKDYEKLVHDHPEYLKPTITHGDAHGGNVFIGPDGKASLIDYGSAMWSIGKNDVGVADRANDLGRMAASIRVEALKNGLLRSESDQLVKTFLDTYKKQAGIISGSEEAKALDTAIAFYKARYFSLQSSDVDHIKFKTKTDTMGNRALRQRLGHVWLNSFDGP